jgi:hypothetical protein
MRHEHSSGDAGIVRQPDLHVIRRPCVAGRQRSGAATIEYVLVLGALLPMVAFALWTARRIMALTYEMICVFVTWPF